MLRFLIKLLVVSFYKSNAGFFLFFFFFFFGVVEGGSLITYHLSLMMSMLQSPVILGGVMVFWLLYHLKCVSYCLQIINSAEGSFLFNVQTVPRNKQSILFFCLHLLLYAPVLVYSLVLMVIGWQKGYDGSTAAIALFSLFICCLGTVTYYRRLNNRQKQSLQFGALHKKPKPFLLIVLYYFGFEKKVFVLSLKAVSLALLYVVLILNRRSYDNDLFIFFYQLLLMIHTVFPFLALKFLEQRFSFYRNLPFPLFQYGAVYFVTYAVLLLPELFYLLLNGWTIMGIGTITCYYLIAVSSLCLLTSIQYSESTGKNDYPKVVFALFFVTTFALHAQAFLFWILIQFSIAILLFRNGFFKYQPS